MSVLSPAAAPRLSVRKRSGSTVDFNAQKIRQAVLLCLVNSCGRTLDDSVRVLADKVTANVERIIAHGDGRTSVEQLQDLIESALMALGEHDAAKRYILYRDERRRLREEQDAKPLSIFRRREAFKPFEYPEVVPFKDAINHSYWLVSEFNFISDIHEFRTKLSDPEREAITRTLLAISQIEVSVKRFWANIGQRFPKAEIEQVGISNAESEVRHADAYSHLLKVLGLEDAFSDILKVPAIRARVDYLQDALRGSANVDDDEYALTLSLFSLFVENVSLFSQFAVIKSFNRHRQTLKDVDNVVQATAKEEQLHALFGVWLVNQIREERPDWFNVAFYARVETAARRAFEAESKIVDWIFEAGELPFLPKASVIEFIKHRLNESIEMIGGAGPFTVNPEALESLRWFTDELAADVHTDFFHKRPVTYSKKSAPITADSLF